MRRMLFAAVLAATAMALGGGTAAAGRSFANNGGRTIEGIDRAFTLVEPGGVSIRCEVMILGVVMTSNVQKTRGWSYGNITRITVRNCTSSVGAAATLTPLVSEAAPWPMIYESFTGTLPRITEILTIWLTAFLISLEGTRPACLYGGNVGVSSTGRTDPEEYTIRSFRTQTGNRVPLVTILSEEFLRRCPRTLELRGTFTGERIEVRHLLI